MITIDLGFSIARIKHVNGEVTSIELFTPPDGSDNGVIQAQYVFLNATAAKLLMQGLENVKVIE